MSKDRIHAFAEGPTEYAVLEGLCARGLLPKERLKLERCEGQERQRAELDKNIEAYLKTQQDLPESARGPLRILVLRDQDANEITSVVASIQGVLRRHFPSAELAGYEQHERVFVTQAPIRAALYVAGDAGITRWFPFVSHRTTDDTLLMLALCSKTAQNMLEARHESRRSIGSERLIAKVTREIPELLSQNGMTPFVTSKDHVRFYSALLGVSTSAAFFAQMVLKHAEESELRTHFAPLLAAVEALS